MYARHNRQFIPHGAIKVDVIDFDFFEWLIFTYTVLLFAKMSLFLKPNAKLEDAEYEAKCPIKN